MTPGKPNPAVGAGRRPKGPLEHGAHTCKPVQSSWHMLRFSRGLGRGGRRSLTSGARKPNGKDLESPNLFVALPGRSGTLGVGPRTVPKVCSAEEKFQIVLEGRGPRAGFSGICPTHGVGSTACFERRELVFVTMQNRLWTGSPRMNAGSRKHPKVSLYHYNEESGLAS